MKLSPAYHLRTNKAVERLLFVELLRKLDRTLNKPIAKYRYVSLGGPYLEDFALIHNTFGNQAMTSLEIKKEVRTRQLINQPHSRVDLTLDSTTDFVDKYQPGRTPLIAWFDYEHVAWKAQILESCALLQKLPSMSVFKITLPCSTSWLGGGDQKDPQLAKAAKLSSEFSDYGSFIAADVNKDQICKTVYRILRRAIADAVPDTKNRCVRSLASYSYDDGTPILTVAMIIGPVGEISAVMNDLDLADWPFSDLSWNGPKEIAIPSLSAREKMAVDRLLPDASARKVVGKLKLRLAEDFEKSVAAMANYVQFYRHVPQFLRVTF
jgi:hypothetical protein